MNTTNSNLKREQQADYHHGRSPAAWTGSIMAMFGFILITVAIIGFQSWPLIWFGAAVVLLAGITTQVLKGMGYGNPPRELP